MLSLNSKIIYRGLNHKISEESGFQLRINTHEYNSYVYCEQCTVYSVKSNRFSIVIKLHDRYTRISHINSDAVKYTSGCQCACQLKFLYFVSSAVHRVNDENSIANQFICKNSLEPLFICERDTETWTWTLKRNTLTIISQCFFPLFCYDFLHKKTAFNLQVWLLFPYNSNAIYEKKLSCGSSFTSYRIEKSAESNYLWNFSALNFVLNFAVGYKINQ